MKEYKFNKFNRQVETKNGGTDRLIYKYTKMLKLITVSKESEARASRLLLIIQQRKQITWHVKNPYHTSRYVVFCFIVVIER